MKRLSFLYENKVHPFILNIGDQVFKMLIFIIRKENSLPSGLVLFPLQIIWVMVPITSSNLT
jgi:hypothetical protein